ncbi:MAG: hypothetical protein JNN20_09955 [Betaproteobacteria bacterium]|nr:hypothetical protein [Betaproteobacteria bacterium]
MKLRALPPDLYHEVLDLVTRIAQPCANPIDNVDESVASEALEALRALYERHESSGNGDPFLTESLADFVPDDTEAIRLYRLALVQSASFGGEPTHTKRFGLADRLFAANFAIEAREQLAMARKEATEAGDDEAVREIDEMARECADL